MKSYLFNFEVQKFAPFASFFLNEMHDALAQWDTQCDFTRDCVHSWKPFTHADKK